MRLLVLSFFPAFTPPSNGGEARLFYFYQSLSRWFDVTLLSSSHFGCEEQVIKHGPCFKERRIPKDEYFAHEIQRLQEHAGSGELSGPCLAACSEYPTKIHLAYLQEYPQADVVIHESPFLSGCDLFAGVDNKPRIYNSHNAEFDLYRQLHPEPKRRRIRDLVSSAEKHVLQFSDLVFYCNRNDLKLFKDLAPSCVYESMHVPHGAHPRKLKVNTQKSPTSKLKCVFMGSGHPPNVEAARFLVDSVAPHCPEVEFTIVGSCLKEGGHGKNVLSLGRVDDARKNDILSSVDVALNPMAFGSGSNVKVLDYFANGLPLISTEFGMRGIEAVDGEHFIDSSLESFAAEIKKAATETSRLERIGRNAWEFVAGPYSWESISEQAAKRIQQLAKEFESKERKQVLLVLNDYDSFAGIGGGCTRTRGLYEACCHWSQVVFLCFSTNGLLRKTQVNERIVNIEIPMTKEHASEISKINNLFHVSANDIVAGKHCSLSPILRHIYEQLRTAAELVVVEHCYLAPIPYLYGDKFVYSSHNNELKLKKEILKGHPLADELINHVAFLENIAVQHAAYSIAVCAEDADSLLCRRVSSGPMAVVPNGASAPPKYRKIETARLELNKIIKQRAVAFLGSSHMPNIQAAKYICDVLAPKLPEVEFHLIGSVCEAVVNKPANVVFWGVVSGAAKSAILQSCAVAINPMSSGGGSNIKMSDYVANGLFTISTPYGSRGYDDLGPQHLRRAFLHEFPKAVAETLSDNHAFSPEIRQSRQKLFDQKYNIVNSGRLFTEVLKGINKKRRKVLFVTYRYTWPLQGGAETYVEQLLRALGESDSFDVDVVATEVSSISEHMRFASDYLFDANYSAPSGVRNLRYARFPLDETNSTQRERQLRAIWSTQPHFEKELYEHLVSSNGATGLAWGWADPESAGGSTSHRWALANCGLHCSTKGRIWIQGFAPYETVLTAFQGETQLGDPWTVNGKFAVKFAAEGGSVEIRSSSPAVVEDPRPIAFYLTGLEIGKSSVDLSKPMLWQQAIAEMPVKETFAAMGRAADETRGLRNVRLNEVRGPHSSELEAFIAKHVHEYDLVITHNSVFRPAVVAVQEAKRAGKPSILLPHLHLDDDFYHFPDVLECAREADLVLASPKAAVEFLVERGCNAEYHFPGCDTAEQFTQEDQQAFRDVYTSKDPFVLVLGRKAGAKRYRDIIKALEDFNSDGVKINVVLIGPDDDKLPIDSRCATYLGPQPRSIVRGALMSCLALCNMSVSESFGIVLLEAWLAGKPVIANKHCPAFHDLAEHGVDALLVEPAQLGQALRELHGNHQLATALGNNGRIKCDLYDWGKIKQDFVAQCLQTISDGKKTTGEVDTQKTQMYETV